MIRIFRAALAATLLLAAAPAFANDGVVQLGSINISAPFARATLPNAPVGGGFLTIENTGTEADRLVSVAASVSGDAQLHEMAMQGDVMKMRQLKEGVDLPAGQTVVLKPGGIHIMFLGIKAPFVEGETIAVTLTFEKSGSVDIELPVEAVAADGPSVGNTH